MNARHGSTLPDISVVIPSYNRRASVCALVAALIVQHDPAIAGEIIVVLDGATDGSAEALATLTPPPWVQLYVISQANRGPGAARNTGWRRARHPIVLFLDDDVVPEAGLIPAHLAAYQQTGADAVVGQVRPVAADWVLAPLAEGANRYHAAKQRRLRAGAAVTPLDVATGNLSVRRAALETIGGFDEAFGRYGAEDWDLGQRLLDRGARIVYAPAAAVTHEFALTPRQWQGHMWHMGQSQARLATKYPHLRTHLVLNELSRGTWQQRVVARAAIQYPGLGLALSTLLLHLLRWVGATGPTGLWLPLVGLSWRLAFWSGVREAVGSARAIRQHYGSGVSA